MLPWNLFCLVNILPFCVNSPVGGPIHCTCCERQHIIQELHRGLQRQSWLSIHKVCDCYCHEYIWSFIMEILRHYVRVSNGSRSHKGIKPYPTCFSVKQQCDLVKLLCLRFCIQVENSVIMSRLEKWNSKEWKAVWQLCPNNYLFVLQSITRPGSSAAEDE